MRTDSPGLELLPETETLFLEMVEAALAVEKPSGRLFLLVEHMGGNSLFLSGPPRGDWTDVDSAGLDDLAAYGLLRKDYGDRGTPNYRVTSDGHRYFQRLLEQRGEAIAQVEDATNRWLDGERFARHYPRASVSLGRAFRTVWGGDTDEQAVSAVGSDLRSAIQDFTDELIAHLRQTSTAAPEKPIGRLQDAVGALGERVGAREMEVLRQLVELARVTLRHVQRLTHVRNEGPVARWDEIRRAAFTVAVVLHEIDRASRPTSEP